MAVFDFPNHRFSTKNPESGFRAKLGNSYQFSAAPSAPDQRVFVLKFPLLKYFLNNDGTINAGAEAEINLARLEQFYQVHKMHLTFTYPHPVYGDVPCRFNKPLEIPEGLPQGQGAVLNIEVELLEQPGLSDSGGTDMTLIEYVDF